MMSFAILMGLSPMCKPGGENMRSCLRMCLEWSSALLDILKNPKNAVGKIALNKSGSVR